MQKQMPCDHFSYSIWPVLFGRILNSCLANYSAPMQAFVFTDPAVASPYYWDKCFVSFSQDTCLSLNLLYYKLLWLACTVEVLYNCIDTLQYLLMCNILLGEPVSRFNQIINLLSEGLAMQRESLSIQCKTLFLLHETISLQRETLAILRQPPAAGKL